MAPKVSVTTLNVMKGIVLAGGTGSRLWPLTHAVSKQLLPVFDKPMIYYPLATLMESGIREILIICRPDESALFQRLLGDGSQLGVCFSYAHQERPNGIAAAFQIAEPYLQDTFNHVTLILGDNFFHGDSIGRELPVPQDFSGARIFAYEVRDPSGYGVVEFDRQGAVRSIAEKPIHPSSPYAIPGLYIYDEEVVSRARELEPSVRGELEISDLNVSYLVDGRLEAKVLPRGTAWLDMGTFEALLDAGSYVRAIEARRSRKVGCLEEVAWRNQWISSEELLKLAEPLMASGYGRYLANLLAAPDHT